MCILGALSQAGEGAGLCLSAIHLVRGTPATVAPLRWLCPNRSGRPVLPYFSFWSRVRLINIHVIQSQMIFTAEGGRGAILISPFKSCSRSNADAAGTGPCPWPGRGEEQMFERFSFFFLSNKSVLIKYTIASERGWCN